MEQAQATSDIMPQNLPARVIHWAKNNTIQLVAVVFWVVLIVTVRQYMTANDLTFGELVNQLAEVLTGTWYGPLIYIVIYLLRPLILFPASLLTILAGTVFGLPLGFAYALVAGTLSAAIPYGIGRWFSGGEKADTDEAEDESANLLKRFTDLLKRNPFQAVLTMRLLYLPYDAVSLVVGSLGIAFIPFALATAIGNIGGTLSFVGIGASADIDFATGEFGGINPLVLGFSVTILVVSLGISRYLNKREAAKQAAAETTATA